MSNIQEQLIRLRRFSASVHEGDPKLAEQSADLEAFESGASAEVLEDAIIAIRRERPVFEIRQNETNLFFVNQADSELWGERLKKAKPLLDTAILAVGRIDLTGALYDWVGTGWLIEENILVTNRHVAELFVSHNGEGFSFQMGLRGPISADVDFLQEVDNPDKLVFKLVKPLHIEQAPGPDVAFFEIETVSGASKLAAPIKLATHIERTNNVATIGYPAYDSRIPEPELMERIFGKTYNKKRLAPGGVTLVEPTRIGHDCVTLGANSGAVVLDLDSGEAIGLHFAGSFLAANYAVRSDVVKNLLINVRSGRVVRRTPRRAREVSVFFSAARDDEERATVLFHRLKEAGFSLWKHSENLMPGADWIRAPEEALEHADVALFLISGSSDNQQLLEMETALRLNFSHGRPLIIPCRHEQLPIPPPISSFLPIDLDEEGGSERLIAAVHQADAQSSATPKPPESLVQACLSASCVLYAGAGLSAPSGFPTWTPLVNDLIEWLRMQRLAEPRSLASLTSLAATGDVDTAADEIVAIIQSGNAENRLTDYLKKIFVPHPPPLNHYHSRISAIPFCAALTTNFDELLEASFPNTEVLTPNDSERLLECLSKHEFFILKLYGAFNRSDSVLVAPAQYTDAVVGNVTFAQFIESLFVSRTLFFVGCSLEGIQAYLEGLKFRRSNRQHYALVGVSGRAWEARAQVLNRRYGIEVIPYSLANNHIEVAEFLDHLVRQIRPQESLGIPNISKPITIRREPRWLKRVSLSGLGLFDHFELELTPDWNILLGNNGVGKSTILKAIAIGLCGRDAQSYVERLLKRGVPTGTIVLETSDGTQYFTDIMRTSGAIEVVARPARSLDAEGWLALGFPPLRLLTWERPTGPMLQEGRARPEAADLIPIISGGLDPRLDTLKQWILTLDYQIKDERTRGGSGDRPQQLLNEFFSIMGNLTGDLVLEFHGVEAGREVLVRTDDGIVPIEAISQGMASLLGWVGVLMQRLYMVFDQEPNPTEQYAMVLIDEIDAHMHPEWQQNLVSSLSRAFPHVQFIATTHSPLIVSGMDVRRITRLERDDEGRVVRTDVAPDMAMGRADQVLTGPLFGLSTTLDVETQNRIGEYRKLLGKRERDPNEEAEFRRLERILEFRVPLPTEGPAERRAQQLLEALLAQQLGHDFPTTQEQLLEKARQLLREAGSAT